MILRERIRLNCCGLLDVIAYDGNTNLAQYQQEDLINFGQLIVSLACGSLLVGHNMTKSLEYLSRQYSADLKNVVTYLLSKPSSYKNIDDVISMMGSRMLEEVNSAHM
jgi:PAB-dependent poly(A)-specific ribonuclease subunit 3